MAERYSTGLRNEVAKAGGKSYADALANGVIRVFTGTQPATADAVETGTLLGEFTVDAGAFTPGVATNGLNLANAVDGVLYKAVAEAWECLGVAAGVAGWYRFYSNTRTTGASTTAIRADGSVTSSGGGGDLTFTNTTFAIGGAVSITDFYLTLPAS